MRLTSSHFVRRSLHVMSLSVASFGMTMATIGCGNWYEPKRECEYGQGRCENGVAYRCKGFQSHYGGGGTEWEGIRCKSQNHCKVDSEGGYCTLTEEPDERCADTRRYCDGQMMVRCRSGFPIEKETCATCSEEEDCQGGWEEVCDRNHPCGPGLTCVTTNLFSACAPECDCDEGSRCPACDVIGERATSEWICSHNVCTARPYYWQ